MTTAILNGSTLRSTSATGRDARRTAPKRRFYFGPFAKQIAELDAKTEQVQADIVALGQIRARIAEELCKPGGAVETSVEPRKEKERV